MVKGKHKGGQPWWRKRRTQRRLALASSLSVVIGVIGVLAWLVVRGGGSESGPQEYLREPAPAFALPTIAGEQVSLAEHVGRHNLLLYFNEGIG